MTLVEVCMAIGIAAFAAIPIMGLLTISMDSMSESTDRSIISRLYTSAEEALKSAAESGNPAGWSITLAFDRELVACASSDANARYAITCVGTDNADVPGGESIPAWLVAITISDLTKPREIFKRNTLIVKEPVFEQNESES